LKKEIIILVVECTMYIQQLFNNFFHLEETSGQKIKKEERKLGKDFPILLLFSILHRAKYNQKYSDIKRLPIYSIIFIVIDQLS